MFVDSILLDISQRYPPVKGGGVYIFIFAKCPTNLHTYFEKQYVVYLRLRSTICSLQSACFRNVGPGITATRFHKVYCSKIYNNNTKKLIPWNGYFLAISPYMTELGNHVENYLQLTGYCCWDSRNSKSVAATSAYC